MDFAAARVNMVDSQLHTSGVTDYRILAAFGLVPRENFVSPERRCIAYMDGDLVVKPARGAIPARSLMEPMVLGRLIELADVGPDDKVLHVGCATGYATAVLAELGREVVAVEEDGALAAEASRLLAGITNARVIHGPHAAGAAAEAPFDVILIEGRIPAVPPALLTQLADLGRLVAVVGERAVAAASLYTRHGGATSMRAAFEAAVGPLPGITVEKPAFVF
jgi:protein-L-isoaspartate(D-aspartate) O-methyltransferase